MRISMNALREWVNLDAITVDELSAKLTMAGLEVEGIEHLGEGGDKIVVGRIDAIDPHPDSKKLVICQVDAGEETLRQIVCGANNMVAGDFVPVALPGSSPPAIDFEIGTRPVAGVESSGMLCAEEELGLTDKSDGLMILDRGLTVGQPIFEALEFNDVRFEIGLTPNRPDCLSHIGVAREVAANFDIPFKPLPDVDVRWDNDNGPVTTTLDVQDAGCPRYAMTVVRNVEVGESPWWLKRQLLAMGSRSINNVVDMTNLIQLAWGQPLHAFDLDKIAGDTIIVRRAIAGEKIVGIDHKEYSLDETDLVIADSEKAIAIAGVMGGAGTEVDTSTKNVLIECAYFDPTTVRRTAKRLGLHTDSSHRFERGTDPNGVVTNLSQAVHVLMTTQNDGEVAQGIVEHYPTPIEPTSVSVTHAHVMRILGTDVDRTMVTTRLNAIGLETQSDDTGYTVGVPTFRPDITRPIDVIEEIARLWGYDNFVATLPKGPMGGFHKRKTNPKHADTIWSDANLSRVSRLREQLLGQGFFEVVNYSFMSDEMLAAMKLPEGDTRQNAIPVANPLSSDQSFMRTMMVSGLLANLQTNLAQRNPNLAIFERGRTYHDDGEREMLSVLVSGQRSAHYTEQRDWDFYDVKGMIESLAAGFDVDTSAATWMVSHDPILHPGVQAVWKQGDVIVAEIGEVHPKLLHGLDIDQKVLVGELFLDPLLKGAIVTPSFSTFGKFPAMHRDMALLLDSDVPYSELASKVERFSVDTPAFGELFDGVSLFDVYAGEQVPEGKKSVAIQIAFRAPDRTLTDDEVAALDAELSAFLVSELGAVRR